MNRKCNKTNKIQIKYTSIDISLLTFIHMKVINQNNTQIVKYTKMNMEEVTCLFIALFGIHPSIINKI